MKQKLPDIKKALEMVTFLKERSKDKSAPIKTKFALCENVWANASVKNDSGTVCLWLGADTMVEYPYDEAIELLKKNLSNAEKYLESVVMQYSPWYVGR
jgi:prefoldin subunit 5